MNRNLWTYKEPRNVKRDELGKAKEQISFFKIKRIDPIVDEVLRKPK